MKKCEICKCNAKTTLPVPLSYDENGYAISYQEACDSCFEKISESWMEEGET